MPSYAQRWNWPQRFTTSRAKDWRPHNLMKYSHVTVVHGFFVFKQKNFLNMKWVSQLRLETVMRLRNISSMASFFYLNFENIFIFYFRIFLFIHYTIILSMDRRWTNVAFQLSFQNQKLFGINVLHFQHFFVFDSIRTVKIV